MAITEADVRKIITIDDISDFTPFMSVAERMIDEHCTDISSTDKDIVHVWLTAHFLTIAENRTSSETAKGVGAKYQYKINLGLECSMYGQMAMQSDPTGGLAKWNKKVLNGTAGRTAGITWLGTEETDEY